MTAVAPRDAASRRLLQQVVSDGAEGADGIACWFVDTDYDQLSFFVRHAYCLGQDDPHSALNRSRIAVKVINHLGDEVMTVFKV